MADGGWGVGTPDGVAGTILAHPLFFPPSLSGRGRSPTDLFAFAKASSDRSVGPWLDIIPPAHGRTSFRQPTAGYHSASPRQDAIPPGSVRPALFLPSRQVRAIGESLSPSGVCGCIRPGR